MKRVAALLEVLFLEREFGYASRSRLKNRLWIKYGLKPQYTRRLIRSLVEDEILREYKPGRFRVEPGVKV